MSILEHIGRWEARRALKTDLSTSQLQETGGIRNGPQGLDDSEIEKMMKKHPEKTRDEVIQMLRDLGKR